MLHLYYSLEPAAQTSSTSDWLTRVAAFIGACVAAYTAYKVSQRDSNATDLKEALRKLKESTEMQENMRQDIIALRRYGFTLQETLAGVGIEAPQPPVLRSGNQ